MLRCNGGSATSARDVVPSPPTLHAHPRRSWKVGDRRCWAANALAGPPLNVLTRAYTSDQQPPHAPATAPTSARTHPTGETTRSGCAHMANQQQRHHLRRGHFSPPPSVHASPSPNPATTKHDDDDEDDDVMVVGVGRSMAHHVSKTAMTPILSPRSSKRETPIVVLDPSTPTTFTNNNSSTNTPLTTNNVARSSASTPLRSPEPEGILRRPSLKLQRRPATAELIITNNNNNNNASFTGSASASTSSRGSLLATPNIISRGNSGLERGFHLARTTQQGDSRTMFSESVCGDDGSVPSPGVHRSTYGMQFESITAVEALLPEDSADIIVSTSDDVRQPESSVLVNLRKEMGPLPAFGDDDDGENDDDSSALQHVGSFAMMEPRHLHHRRNNTNNAPIPPAPAAFASLVSLCSRRTSIDDGSLNLSMEQLVMEDLLPSSDFAPILTPVSPNTNIAPRHPHHHHHHRRGSASPSPTQCRRRCVLHPPSVGLILGRRNSTHNITTTTTHANSAAPTFEHRRGSTTVGSTEWLDCGSSCGSARMDYDLHQHASSSSSHGTSMPPPAPSMETLQCPAATSIFDSLESVA